ncbi:hypothetical protein DLH72_01755 [Candidatus Gracilibacteria bacterium]|nr:MAG: hypothetical protein DLH72_01755 [Candidatus Gracilibacteria bacterium]
MKKVFIIICLVFLFGCNFEKIQNKNFEEKKQNNSKILKIEDNIGKGKENLENIEEKEKKFDINKKIELKIISEFQNQKIEIPNFMFHYIEDVPKNTKDKLRYNLSYSPEKFEELLKYLDENKIETLTFWDLKEILEGKKDLPDKSVILGFDDGHLDHYTRAFPLLKKYNKKGVFFIVSSFPENDQNYMNWKQILEMQDNGQEIGGHSFSHPNLTTIDKNLLQKEILDSKKEIEEKIGKKIISFAYPIGKYNDLVLEYTKKEYLFGRTTKFGDFIDTNNLFTIPTIRINPETSIKSLEKYFTKKK